MSTNLLLNPQLGKLSNTATINKAPIASPIQLLFIPVSLKTHYPARPAKCRRKMKSSGMYPEKQETHRMSSRAQLRGTVHFRGYFFGRDSGGTRPDTR